ncbi:tyrosine--tRNA ligase [Candidatus Micrarchaeota archaeon]|nr:tyrosine--tRNA ligase [Candidatus Micrarchaeota archaeon]
MDLETRFSLVKGISQEIVTEEELRSLLETNNHPLAYDGFEPSGLAHLPLGVYRPLLLKDLLKAGFKFNLLLADTFGWINEKAGGSLENARVLGDYYLEVWKAAGLDLSKVKILWHSDFIGDKEYWKLVLQVARNHNEKRTKRCLAIAGRSEDASLTAAQLFYPSMQVADVFYQEVDVTQLGMDQRKANMLAREIAPSLKRKPPVVVSHKMLLGLQGGSASASDEFTDKMSKSKPNSSIFVHDSLDEIKKKMNKAYCPEKTIEGNPILEYAKEIIFRARKDFIIDRPEKFGGRLEFESYKELEHAFGEGKIHPMDLKNATASHLDEVISPIREHFETSSGKKLLEKVKEIQITR